MKRSTTIDLCRGLLFALMVNTHALTIANVPKEHWLQADFWLPNGWATAVFVVLTGFAAGYIYSARPAGRLRDLALRRRAGEILLVMLLSNAMFAVLRLVAAGDISPAGTLAWWAGFVTLDTHWSISGVLMPTVLVLLCFPLVFRCIQAAPWKTLAVLMLARALSGVAARSIGVPAEEAGWAARFLLLEGLGGFPVLPFVLNGCLGIWLGMTRHRSEVSWKAVAGLLLLLQLVLYFTETYFKMQLTATWYLSLRSFGAMGKFAWMFLIAHVLCRSGAALFTDNLALIGRNALGSFVLHRMILQGLAIVLAGAAFSRLAVEYRFLVLVAGTLVLTWALCASRQRLVWIDTSLRRLAL